MLKYENYLCKRFTQIFKLTYYTFNNIMFYVDRVKAATHEDNTVLP